MPDFRHRGTERGGGTRGARCGSVEVNNTVPGLPDAEAVLGARLILYLPLWCAWHAGLGPGKRSLCHALCAQPCACPNSWEVVAAYVRTRPLDEVLLMVKERQGAASNRLRQQEDWKGAAKKRAEVTSEADLRCMAFTDVEVTVAATPAAPGGSVAAGPGPGSSSGNAGGSSGGAPKAAANGSASAPPAGSGKPKVVSAASGEWSEKQELALVQGLKQFGKELPDR
jgi:hypothetical protein